MSLQSKQFSHVSYFWDEKYAASLAGDEVAQLIYRSNLLGSDLRSPILGVAILHVR